MAIMSSCATIKQDTYIVSLSKVESPKDAKKQFGETKIIPVDIEGRTNYQYEDDYIDIKWYVGSTSFSFIMKNKSNYTLKIPWDDVAYIDINGVSGRVMHNGVKFIDKNNSQPASVIPKNSSFSDIVLPTENVYFLDMSYGGWQQLPLFNLPIDKKNFEESKKQYIGKSARILFPIMIEDVKNDYLFEFEIKDIK